jgi:cytochrome b561
MSDTTFDQARADASTPPAGTYDAVQRWLHWLTAILFLAAVAIGFYASLQTPGTSPRRELLEVHKSLGITIFFLALLRLAYRLWARPPAMPAAFSRLVRWAANSNHWLLYGLMLVMPITGFTYSSAGGHPLKYFWLFDWPRLVGRDDALALRAETLHAWFAWLVYAVVLMHLLAVVWHELVKRDGTLSRMWASRR